MKKPAPPRPKTKKKKSPPPAVAKTKAKAAPKQPTALERIGTLFRRVTGAGKK
jgi:hypothetical protein